MNSSQLSTIEKWYYAYTGRFKASGAWTPKQQLKFDHCLRVAAEIQSLARDLGFNDEDDRTAYVLGLLHDIGRFHQLEKFGTFVDGQSIDHGACGADVLAEAEILDDLADSEREAILDGIRFHNRREIPGNLPPLIDRYARLVRDADKLDGFWIIEDAARSGLSELYRDFFSGKSGKIPQGKADLGLVETVSRGEMISYAETKNFADCLLLQIGWIYDIHYPVSMRRVRDRRVLEKYPSYAPGDEGIEEAIRTAILYRDRRLSV
jgi:putative nucleotidyltransferase with HDIG domain